MTILADPFALSAFGAVLSAVDWPRLSSPKHVADALLDHDPSGDQAPQTARQTAESIILVGLLLMLHSGAAPDLAASDRKRLLDAIQSERITFQNLPVIKHTSLPAGTWKQAFATRSVRLQSQPGAMPEWTLAVNVALDAVRIRFCREVGFFDPASVGSAAAQGSPVAKMLGQALAASYFTVFDYATLNQAMFSANLELLAVYAGELPATWLGASFAQILCVNIYVKSEQQDLLQLSLLCLVAIAARSVAPIEPTTIETLAKGISNTPVTQECMQGIVQLAPKLSDDSLGVLVRALVNPPAGSAPPSGLEVTSSLSSSSANHGSQLSSGTSLLARQSMDELVNIARLFAALGSDRGAAFDKELEKLGAAHRSWRKYLGLQPRVAATWVPKLLALVIDLSEPSGDAFAPFPDIPCPSMSAQQAFAVLGVLMFSFDAAEPVPENRKALIDGLFKHLQRTLLAVVTILGNIGFLVLADLENVIQHGTQLPQATLELSSRAIEVFSCLHFITSQYGLEGFDQWTRWMAVFCSAVARVPGASEALALRCLPGPPLAGPELKLLAEQVFPLARPYAAMAHEKAADADWKPDVDTLDAFDASHSLHLKLFECSSLHRALACSMAPAYVGTLLNLFPKRVDAEMLGLCFGTVIKAFGQVFFSGAIEPSALILGRSHQRHALGDAQTPGGEPAASEANTSDVVLRAADVAASDHAAASEERVASGWEGLDLEARKVAQACIDLLLQRIHDLSEHSGPAARGAGGSIQASPSPLSEGAAATLVPKLSDAAKRARVADILAASEAVSRVVLHDQLLMVLFEQLNTVSLLLLPDLMAEIADLLIGNDARGIAGCGLTKAHSPLWQALFKAVSEDGRVDYTRRLHLVEWYMDLHATATSLIASRPARSPSERAASDTQPPAGLPRLQAKL
nr:hypothetical protein HK105_005680 [Polyrhizophydium stewartii]